MDNYNKNEIIYDADWKTISSPQQVVHKTTDENADDTPEPTIGKSHDHRFVSLITIQLVICIIIALVIFLIKAMNSDTYKDFCVWYRDQMQNTLVSDKTFEDIDLSPYFSYFSKNSSKATIDEI